MTRIIAGFAGSLTIAVPDYGTRPTNERVREAIFSALEARDLLEGATVADLYAGSGALGLEAASRGAAHVTLVEKSPGAAIACRKNAAVLLERAPKNSELVINVLCRPVHAVLAASTDLWDLIFLDPPYDLDAAELAHTLEQLVLRLTPDAVVVLERSSRSPEPAWPRGLELERRKNYGDTTVWWIRPV